MIAATESLTEALVARCVAGEPEAWRELHARYHRLSFVFLQRLGVKGADTEDACQEVFVQVFRYLARFEGRADLKTWIYKLCISQAARRRRRQKVTSALRWFLPTGPAVALPGPHWSESELQRHIEATLGRMKSIHRDVFVLYELEGLSGAEVARVTGLTHATVRRRLCDARQAFEAALSEQSPA